MTFTFLMQTKNNEENCQSWTLLKAIKTTITSMIRYDDDQIKVWNVTLWKNLSGRALKISTTVPLLLNFLFVSETNNSAVNNFIVLHYRSLKKISLLWGRTFCLHSVPRFTSASTPYPQRKIYTLKGVLAKNERGYRLTSKNIRWGLLPILLLSVLPIRRKLFIPKNFDSDRNKNQFNSKHIIQILQPIIIDFFDAFVNS